MRSSRNILPRQDNTLKGAEIINFWQSQSTDYQHSFSCKNLTINTNKEKDSLRLNPQSEGLCGARLTSPLDLFTRFYYFGARYYDPVLSGLFISIDTMADKYPSLSPYAYCAWNPVKLVDPDGSMIDDYYNLKGKLVYKTESGDNKYLLLTDESKIDNPNNYPSVAVPSMTTLKKMESMYSYAEKNEQGIVLGTDGNSSSIINGNWDEITPQQWEPALKEIDNVDCLIHLHTADYDNCKIGSANPSDKDLNENNFFNSSKTGVILSKRRNEFDNSVYMRPVVANVRGVAADLRTDAG